MKKFKMKDVFLRKTSEYEAEIMLPEIHGEIGHVDIGEEGGLYIQLGPNTIKLLNWRFNSPGQKITTEVEKEILKIMRKEFTDRTLNEE